MAMHNRGWRDTGQGFETSMDVEFTVDLIPNQLLDQPWAENDEYIMVSGIGGSLTEALQMPLRPFKLAQELLSTECLRDRHTSRPLIHYDVASAAGAQAHVVAKIRKTC